MNVLCRILGHRWGTWPASRDWPAMRVAFKCARCGEIATMRVHYDGHGTYTYHAPDGPRAAGERVA